MQAGKSDRAARKKQKVIVIKEVKFSVTVDEHDYQTKKNMAIRFLNEGDKVKASLRFKGRQMAHRDLGYKIVNRLILDIGDNGIVEFMPRMEGTTLHAILAPSKKAEVQQPPAVKKPAPPVAAAPKPPAPEPDPAATEAYFVPPPPPTNSVAPFPQSQAPSPPAAVFFFPSVPGRGAALVLSAPAPEHPESAGPHSPEPPALPRLAQPQSEPAPARPESALPAECSPAVSEPFPPADW